MRPGGYSIHVVTDDPEVFDLFIEACKDRVWAASMINWDSGDNWMRQGAERRGGSLSDPGDVGMQVVDDAPKAPPEGKDHEATCAQCGKAIVSKTGLPQQWLDKANLGQPGSSFCGARGWHVPDEQPDPWADDEDPPAAYVGDG